jgi:hypothetical protein
MNEQVKILWAKAAESNFGDSWEEQTAFMSKFAELIVRECMRMCDCADSSYLEHGCDLEASGAAGAKEIIKEWFEVEE